MEKLKLMIDHAYNAQRARTKANDAAHQEMMEWYAERLNCSLDELRLKLVTTDKKTLKTMWKDYHDGIRSTN